MHRELAQTELLAPLLATDWIHVLPSESQSDEPLLQDPIFLALGSGEQACILLARALPEVVLLTSDNKARRFAQSLGLTVVSIPAFLLACKMAGLVSPEQMKQIVQDLRDKDFYEFKSGIRDALLK